MRHPIRVVNPKETCNQRCPVFPNRTPGRQPSISHGSKVAGSTFFKIPKTNCSSELNSTEHVWILVSATNLRSLYLVQHSPRLSVVVGVFSVSHKSESDSIWMKRSVPRGGSAKHLRTQAATISLQESLYPLLPTILSVYKQVPRQQPSRAPAPLWKRRTAPAEVWVASNDSVVRMTSGEKRCAMSAFNC